jgi:sugar transferase (PEP-CTERM/EpsH1 system associated)
MMAASGGGVPVVAHVVYRMDTGGMENGLVNIVNRMPPERYRHVIVSLTATGEFGRRIARDDVAIVNLGEGPGHSYGRYVRLWRVLKRLGPAIVHTRNLPTLEAQIPAALLGGVKRVHGEHGRDVHDLHGSSRKYKLLRRAVDPLIHRYIAVSSDLEQWLTEGLGIAAGRVRQIYNGVALDLFRERQGPRPNLCPAGFLSPDSIVVGTVGRLAEVKDQLALLRAFAGLAASNGSGAQGLRLVIAGEGPLRGALESAIRDLGLNGRVWLAGDRADIPQVLQCLDIFVLPSLAEGVSNTILEAMATGLPVVATRVGGNLELVQPGVTGTLVPVSDPDALAQGLLAYVADPGLRRRHGATGREFVTGRFDWDRCVEAYLRVYDELLDR